MSGIYKNPQQVAKQMGWRQGKRIAKSNRPINMGDVIEGAEAMFTPACATHFIDGVVGGYGYARDYRAGLCSDSEWNHYYTGARQSPELHSLQVKLASIGEYC